MKGLPQKYIMERTGHRDVRSLQKYERPDIQTKIGFCKSLDCGAVTRDKEKGNCLNEEPAQDVHSIRDFNVSTKQDVKPEDMERKKRRLEIPERSYFDKCVFNFF